MTSAASGKHRGQRRLLTEAEPGQFARHSVEARALGMTWSAWTRAVQDESVKMPEVIVFGVRAVGTDQIRFVGRTARALEQRRREGFAGKLGEWCATVEWELFELERTTVSASAEAEARWVAELGGDGLLFNPRAGASGAVTGEVRFAVGLPRETHAAALELACAGHWSLGAFVQLAVEKLIARMKAGESVEVRAPGAEPAYRWTPVLDEKERWCSDCGERQRQTPSGWICAQGHGGTASVFSEKEASQIRADCAHDGALDELPAPRPAVVVRRSPPTPKLEHFARQPRAPIGSAFNPRSAVGDDAPRNDDDDGDDEPEETSA